MTHPRKRDQKEPVNQAACLSVGPTRAEDQECLSPCSPLLCVKMPPREISKYPWKEASAGPLSRRNRKSPRGFGSAVLPKGFPDWKRVMLKRIIRFSIPVPNPSLKASQPPRKLPSQPCQTTPQGQEGTKATRLWKQMPCPAEDLWGKEYLRLPRIPGCRSVPSRHPWTPGEVKPRH